MLSLCLDTCPAVLPLEIIVVHFLLHFSASLEILWKVLIQIDAW